MVTALQRLWKDKCTVTEYTKEGSRFAETITLRNQPCKLSFSTLQSTDQTDGAARLVQVTKLFLDPAIQIKPGSKITVMRPTGLTLDFSQSGLPGVFTNHQEIVLAPFRGWS